LSQPSHGRTVLAAVDFNIVLTWHNFFLQTYCQKAEMKDNFLTKCDKAEKLSCTYNGPYLEENMFNVYLKIP
jgi:hypothetical protein